MWVKKSPCCSSEAVVLGFVLLFLFVGRCNARAATDPSEVRALNAILERWTNWTAGDLSAEPCSGAPTAFHPNFNPVIKCDCSYDANTTCHITQLRVPALDVVGSIPEELQNLTYLNNFPSIFIAKEMQLGFPVCQELDLGQNYLTGPLPAFIGNLTAMQYLSVGINALSGTIPKELGQLQNLLSLSLGTNNFSGSIPPELGNLTKLQQLYIDSSGLSGELPSSLSKLKSLRILWASDNDFTGKIPEFIGSWTSLTTLRLQGNNFEGPIPSSFSHLTKLNDLRIGDILNGSSSLGFLRNLASLGKLILRNSRISDTLPLGFSQYASLETLDLSFNNLTGPLPESLFNMSSLNYLFLGNNSLSGNLPTQKSSSLQYIDLSYNQLSGNFPDWVGDQNLQLNLVANNFVIDSSNGSVLPVGLSCLQRDIPCGRGSPNYYSFAINCGGRKSVTTSSGTVFEADYETLNAASYYVTNFNKWAISNVGSFLDASNAEYIISSSSQFLNTQYPGLFQTARLSPSSLRYYGLGLENGNYTVELQFSEADILHPPTWKSVGRRVFDIYIQGNLKEKDFDIRKEAGGASFKAVVRNYTAPVTNNFLEIHFFWAGKGTCSVPNQGYYGASVSAISVSPEDFIPTYGNKPPTISSTNKRDTGLIVGIAVGGATLGLLAIIGILIWRQKRRMLNNNDDEELLGMSTRPDTFGFAELKTATEDFHPANKLGEGGFGPVFKGKLSDGRTVAVKQLSAASRQGKRQFMTEIATISAVQHRNLVKLYGCCIKGDKRLLVYEYLVNKSLDQAIFGESSLHLDWPTRFEICLGTARGLAYLHEESRIRIVHRDVKASNILLDADLNPKISDFGLAKLYDDKKTHISTRVAGTIGYLAPEYAMRGHLTEKADVFAFGVVALEIISGRPNADQNLEAQKVYLLEWAWHLHEIKRELELIDSNLPSFDEEEAARVIGVALLCTQSSPTLRPHMSRAVAMLMGDIQVSAVISRPGYLTGWQFDDVSSNFTGYGYSVPSNTATADSQPSMPSDANMAYDTGVAVSSSQPILRYEFID